MFSAQENKKTTSESVIDWLMSNSTLTHHAFSIKTSSVNSYTIEISDNPSHKADNQFWLSPFSKAALSKKLQAYPIQDRKKAILAKNHQGQNVLHFILGQSYSSLTEQDVVLRGYSVHALTDYKLAFVGVNRSRIEISPSVAQIDITTQSRVFDLFKTNVIMSKNAQRIVIEQLHDSWVNIKEWLNPQKKNKIIAKLLMAQDREGKTPTHGVFSNPAQFNQTDTFSILLDAISHVQSDCKNKLLLIQDHAGNNIFHCLLQKKVTIDLDAFLKIVLDENLAGRDVIRGALLQRNNDGDTPIFYLLKSHQHEICQLLLPYLNRDDLLTLTHLKNREGKNALFYHQNWQAESDIIPSKESLSDESTAQEDMQSGSDNECASHSPSQREWTTKDDDNELPLRTACKQGKLSEIKNLLKSMDEEGREWKKLDVLVKTRVFMLACERGKSSILDFLCTITPPHEIQLIATKYGPEIELALQRSTGQMTPKEYTSIIAKHTAFYQLHDYFNKTYTHKVFDHNSQAFKARLLDFVTVLKNIEEGKNPFAGTRDFFKNSYKLFSGTERYQELRNMLCNQTPIITGKGQVLVNQFKNYLMAKSDSPVATFLLDKLEHPAKHELDSTASSSPKRSPCWQD